jgi:hypothetical protein
MNSLLRVLIAVPAIAAGLANLASAQITGPVINVANGHRYWVAPVANMTEYRNVAANLGGYPAVINSAEENQWITTFVLPLAPPEFDAAYFGLSDEIVEGEWLSIVDVAVTYTNWNPFEPNNSGNEDYATISRSGGWNDLGLPPFGLRRPAIIEAPLPNNVGNAAGALYGPIHRPETGSTYYVLTPARFGDAQNTAVQDFGGHLVVVNDAAEQLFITRNILRLPNLTPQVFIGLTDEGAEGFFRWVNGDTSTYRRWAAGNPSNSGGIEHYGAFLTTGAAWGFWNDAADNLFNAIVEVEPLPADCNSDYNQDGFVDFFDFDDFVRDFENGC